MALTKGKRVGGAFLNLKELARDCGPTLVIFRIKEHLPAEKATGFAGVNCPVIADAAIASGPRQGEVWLAERFIGAITGPLRGVPNAKEMKNVLPPETSVGEEIVLRVKLVNEGKSNEGAVGDEPSDPEMEAADKVYADGAIWNAASSGNGSTNGAAQPAAAGAGGGRPW